MTNEIYGTYSAPISYEHCNGLLRLLEIYANNRERVLHLAISSDGGDISAGVMIYNALRGIPLTVHTYNIGSVNSVANLMYLAGDRRFCSETSSFCYHSAGFYAQPNLRIDAKLLREWSAKIKTDNGRLFTIIRDRTKLDDASISNLLETEQFLPAGWAVENGIAHEIRPFEIPDGASRVSYLV